MLAEPVAHGLFGDHAPEDPEETPALDDGEHLQPGAHLHLARRRERRGALDAGHRVGHDLAGQARRHDRLAQGRHQPALDRREPRLAHRRRGGRRVPAAAEARGDRAGVDRADAAAPDHVDPRAHAHRDKNGAEVLHLAQLAGEDGKVADVAGARGRGDPDLHAPDRVPPQGPQQVVEEQHLLRRQVAGDPVRHDVEIRPLLEEPRRGLQIAGRRRGEGQRARVLVDAQGQQRRLLGGKAVAAPAQEFDHQGDVRADLLDHLDRPGDILGAGGVVVVDVHLHAGPGGDRGERADAVAPPGVDEDDPGDLRRIERAQPRHPVASRRGLEILAQRPLLRAGEDELRPRVELLRRHHRGERVELGLQVGGDDLHRQRRRKRSPRLQEPAVPVRLRGPDAADLHRARLSFRRWRPPLRATPAPGTCFRTLGS